METILKILISFFWKHKLLSVLYTLFTCLSYPLEAILIPQLYSQFFNQLNAKTSWTTFKTFFIWITCSICIIYFSNFATQYIDAILIPELAGYLINYIFKNLLELYENNATELELGKIVSRMATIPHDVKNLVSDTATWIFPRLITILFIQIYFFYLNWQLGIISLVLLILFFSVIAYYFFFKCNQLSMERYQLFEMKNQMTQDKMANSFSIYSMGNLYKEIENFYNQTDKYKDIFKRSLLCLNNASFITMCFLIVIMLSLNLMTVYLFLQGKITHTQLMAIFITIIYYIPNLETIGASIPNLIQVFGSLEAVDGFMHELYENEREKGEHNSIHTLQNNQEIKGHIMKTGTIVIRDLTFSYNKKEGKKEEKNLFQNYYLSILNGEKVAIVGRSGGGKSTLIKLIMGYYPVPENTILLDGQDIHQYTLNDLRKQIGYVNQNTKLFATSLLENIQYGNNTSPAEIADYLQYTHLDRVFVNLKQGLETHVGVEGSQLSGGQRQIVHILRCIFRKNRIVILDEPTSALDKENRKYVMNAIEQLSRHCTLVVITHDEELLPFFDRVIKI